MKQEEYMEIVYVIRELFNIVEMLAEYIKTDLDPLIQRTIHDRLEGFRKGVLFL